MKRLFLILAALGGLALSASPAAAMDPWYGFCNATDHQSVSLYSTIYHADPTPSDDYEAAFRAYAVERATLTGEPHAYCFNYQTREQAEAELAKMVAAEGSRRVVRLDVDPTRLSKPSGPSGWDAQAFLKEVLTNGVSRVHPMPTTDSRDTIGSAVKAVSYGKCDTTITYIGDWFGSPADYVLRIDWTRALEVGPFFDDLSKSDVKILASTQQTIISNPKPIPGVSIATGSESMEARLTKALNVLVDSCRPKSSTGF